MIPDTLSPLDSRYARETAALRHYFSEFALQRDRIRVELDYLRALSQAINLVRPITREEEGLLESLVTGFDVSSSSKIKEIEQQTRHDVKAIEYFLQQRLGNTSLADVIPWLHFGLTSEDVNQIAQAIELRDARDHVILPALEQIVSAVTDLTRRYRDTVMLARTHGQAAVPTTLGKEFAVFLVRLKKVYAALRDHRFEGKLGGAVGNLNALAAAAPQVDWMTFSAEFVRQYGLEPNSFVTQLLPYDNWIRYFDALALANNILIDMSQDLWRYISDDYLRPRVVATEVGSSTMPQKVNPIDFENAEGNLGVANALLSYYAQKLPISRLQRDLSDSTVRRTFGVAHGHILLGYANIKRGLGLIEANTTKLNSDIESHWEVIAEGIQTILRKARVPDAYEQLKGLARGKTLDEKTMRDWIQSLDVSDEVRAQLNALSPHAYTGLAQYLVNRALDIKW